MRNPYSVGGWVRGHKHYGRHYLIQSLLAAPHAATWVVGTRRLGKTSLLRQMELITGEELGAWQNAQRVGDSEPEASGNGAKRCTRPFVPLYVDLQGCESPDDVAHELELALDDRRRDLDALGIDLDELPTENAVAVLRQLARAIDERGARLLLLIDEAEALLTVAGTDARWLGTLRKALFEGRMRTVMTSTRALSRLNHLNANWSTSPFLFGFQLVYLWSLGQMAAAALVRQCQGATVQVDERVLAQILAYCNGHPYLIQCLCDRLYEPDAGNTGGHLRNLVDADLAIDHQLEGFFFIDLHNMTKVERRILLTLSALTLATEQELVNELYDIPPVRVRTFLYSLSRLGYIRSLKNQWAIGNEFLRRWLLENQEELSTQIDSTLDDAEEETHLRSGAQGEAERLRKRIREVETKLAELQKAWKQARGSARGQLADRILELREELAQLRKALEQVAQFDAGPEE